MLRINTREESFFTEFSWALGQFRTSPSGSCIYCLRVHSLQTCNRDLVIPSIQKRVTKFLFSCCRVRQITVFTQNPVLPDIQQIRIPCVVRNGHYIMTRNIIVTNSRKIWLVRKCSPNCFWCFSNNSKNCWSSVCFNIMSAGITYKIIKGSLQRLPKQWPKLVTLHVWTLN